MRYIFSVIAVIVFVVIAIILIATSGSHQATQQKVINLDNYNYAGTSVSQTTNGELVGEDERSAIKITITQSERTIEILGGYENNVSKNEAYPNTPAAYSAFLQGLQVAGFTEKRTTDETNMWGICALGSTYQYKLNDSNGTVLNTWGTSCSASDGTMNGSGPLVRQLFQMQIDNFSSFTSKVNFGPND